MNIKELNVDETFEISLKSLENALPFGKFLVNEPPLSKLFEIKAPFYKSLENTLLSYNNTLQSLLV